MPIVLLFLLVFVKDIVVHFISWIRPLHVRLVVQQYAMAHVPINASNLLFCHVCQTSSQLLQSRLVPDYCCNIIRTQLNF